MAVTLKDIAEEMGVSAMTVSRALRGVDRISSGTRKRARTLAVRMGYQPVDGVMFRPPMRAGKAAHSLKILLPTVVRRIGEEGGAWWNDRMVSAMKKRLELYNGKLVEQHFNGIEELVEEYRHGRFHGIALMQPLPTPWIRRLMKSGPVVYAVEYDYQTGVDSVYSNEHRSTSMIKDYLRSYGHSNIAWFGIIDRNAPHHAVWDDCLEGGYPEERDAFSVHGARHASWANHIYCQRPDHGQKLILIERDWKLRGLDDVVGEALKIILSASPEITAVVCSCDPVALELVRQLKQKGIEVPRNISLISYGGSEEVRRSSPPITSATMPMETIGRMIPELIERRLADPDAIPVSMQFETPLFEGASVAEPGCRRSGKVRGRKTGIDSERREK